MPARSLKPEFDPHRWYRMLSLLSLDVVRPFYDLTGFVPLDARAFQQSVRDAIAASEKRGQTASMQALLDQLALSLGVDAWSDLIWWERHVFHGDPRDGMALRKWTTVLQACRAQPASWRGLGFPAELADQALARFQRSRRIDEYRKLQSAIDAQPLSDWDSHLYAVNQYDDNARGDDETGRVADSPRLWIVPTIRDYQGYRFWQWLLKALPSGGAEILWEQAKRIVEEQQLSSARGLEHPSVLALWP